MCGLLFKLSLYSTHYLESFKPVPLIIFGNLLQGLNSVSCLKVGSRIRFHSYSHLISPPFHCHNPAKEPKESSMRAFSAIVVLLLLAFKDRLRAMSPILAAKTQVPSGVINHGWEIPYERRFSFEKHL